MTAHAYFQPVYPPRAPFLNIAATAVGTESLGPGLRSVVWVQGCPFRCQGCLAQDWLAFIPARQVRPEALVDELLGNPYVTGLTFSGGEPMMQAAALARLVRLARKQRDLTVISYSGFTLEQLQHRPPAHGVADLLDQLDVLIDGQYRPALNDNQGLRGSSNQRVHHLSGRLAQFDFETAPRSVELRLEDGYYLMVGVPPRDLVEPLNQAVSRANAQANRKISYERLQAYAGLD
jgi:anaerobic ribonucleoside-triphosphate reductase activating protein